MQKTITKFLVLTIAFTFALSVNYLFAAWTGPTQAPTGGNTSTSVHVGATDQVKGGGLSLDGLSVFGGGYFQGNVGIGTVSPLLQFHVRKDYQSTWASNTYNSNTLLLQNGDITDGNYEGISFYTLNNIGDPTVVASIGAINTNHLVGSESGDIGFVTRGGTPDVGERMRLTSEGNLGVGTINPSEKLDVSGNIQASGTICDGSGCIGSINQIIEARTVYHNTQDLIINFINTFTAVPVVVVTSQDSDQYCSARNISVSSFTVFCQNDGGGRVNANINYIAIGS